MGPMRKVVLEMHTSHDGVVATQDGSVDWLYPHAEEEMERWELDLLWRADVHVMGRGLYEIMAGHWPASVEAAAKPMNEIPKVVFSGSLQSAEWPRTRIERRSAAAGIAALREEPGDGAILVHGGPRFAQSVSDEGLVDEYHLLVHPLTIGPGPRPFADRSDLVLTDVRSFPAGAVALSYRRG
jgi:dihydrofolate reductase